MVTTNRGFLAASIAYRNGSVPPNYCGAAQGWHKVKCAYSGSINPNSATSVICGLSQAGCSTHGIVTVGMSQGGTLAALARNFDTRVRGAWTMGFVDHGFAGNHEPCLDFGVGTFNTNEARLLSNSRLRVFRGGNELVLVNGVNAPVPAAWLNQTTGRACGATATSCLTGPNSSGWYKVPEIEINFPVNPDRHCFMTNSPLLLGLKQDCTADSVPDPVWALVPPVVPPSGTYTSGLYQNIQWLKNKILPLGNQP